MSKLTEEARGRVCQIRLFGCKWDADVVGCHYPLTDHTGMAMKAPDFMLAWGCSHCHNVVDSRQPYLYENLPAIENALLRAVLRTQAILAGEGKLVYVPGGARDFDV